MAIAHSSGRVQSGDVCIHFRKLGRAGGMPLLIVHGLSYCSWDWLAPAQELAADREVVAMDMRGFGDSDWSPKKDYSVPAMAQDIVNVLDHLEWEQAGLIGHSMGGRSTTYVAAKHGDRVAGLALVDFTPENASAGAKRVTQAVAGVPDIFASIEAAMAYFGQKHRERFEHYLKPVDGGFIVKRDTYFRDQFRKLLETGERPKLGVDMWQLIGEVRCPILSVRGSRSDMYAPETKEKMKASNPRMAIAEVDAGHNIAGENLEGFLGALRPFLAGLQEKNHAH
jgi:pimeloyl-ACP methyl ester carboxylesterase